MNTRLRERPLKQRRVWIFAVDGRNVRDIWDLEHLDRLWWGANPNARRGDIVLMYRTAPFSDIAYVFRLSSTPRKSRPEDRADPAHVAHLSDKLSLEHPIHLSELRSSRSLSPWSFSRMQQGVLRRVRDVRAEGYWGPLLRLFVSRNPRLATYLRALTPADGAAIRGRAPTRRPRRTNLIAPEERQQHPRLRVFLSYASEDREPVSALADRLRKKPWLHVWLDQQQLEVGVDFRSKIEATLRSSDAVIVCFSKRLARKISFVQRELKWAIDAAKERPAGIRFIFPVKLEPCDIPSDFAAWHYCDLYQPSGYRELSESLLSHAHELRALAL